MRSHNRAGIWILLISLLPSHAAFADDSIWRLLDTALARYVLHDTAEGKALLARVLGEETLALRSAAETQARFRLELSRPEFSRFRAELEHRLVRIRDRAGDVGIGVNHVPTWTGPERRLIRELASRELELQASRMSFNVDRIAFVGIEDPAPDPVYVPERAASLEERQSLVRRATGWAGDMRSCVKNSPPPKQRRANLRYLLSQLGIDETMTTVGALTAAGVQHMDWKNLPADLAYEAMASTLGSRVLASQGGLLVRWFRISGFGLAQSGADAILYIVSPIKNTAGATDREAALKRLEYNALFELSYAPLQMTLYELVTGLECLFPNAKAATAITTFRLSAALGVNFAYFRIRRHFIDPKLN